MINLVFAFITTMELIVAVLFAIYCWKLVTFFGLRTRIGKSWIPMFISGIILLVVSIVAVMPAFGITILPEWGRDLFATVFRVTLFISVATIFHAWKNLGK